MAKNFNGSRCAELCVRLLREARGYILVVIHSLPTVRVFIPWNRPHSMAVGSCLVGRWGRILGSGAHIRGASGRQKGENMGRTILITGASSGIGESCANLFAEKGWNVVATMRD